MSEFDDAVEEIVHMEKSKMIPYNQYKKDVEIVLGVKFSPSEFSTVNYGQLLSLYNRLEKIRTTSKRFGIQEVVVSKKKAKEAMKEIVEISREESNLDAEEEKKPISTIKFERDFHKEEEKVEEEFPEIELEKERETVIGEPEIGEDIEEEKVEEEIIEEELPENISPIVFESVVREREELERQKERTKQVDLEKISKEVYGQSEDIEYITDHKNPEITRFPILDTNPENLGLKKYMDISKDLETGSVKLSKREMKSKMLDLTKQLFREKLTSKREEIKREIIKLKVMISSKGSSKLSFKTILERLPQEFETEIFEYINTMENLVHHEIRQIRNDFYDALSKIQSSDIESRRQAQELFSNDISIIERQTIEYSKKTLEFITRYHTSIIDQIKQNSKSTEAKACDKIINQINKEYPEKFDSLSGDLKEFADVLRVKSNHDAKVEQNEGLNVLFEVVDMGEEQLLNYLRSKHKTKYNKYADKKVSKTHAILYAIFEMSKEKGLSNELLRKYFKRG